MLLTLTVAVLAITLLQQPQLSAGWQWDAANAAGYFGFACALYLFIEPGHGPQAKAHRITGYVTGAAVCIHAGWLLLADATLWHYLALDAPLYMLAGLAGATLLSVLIALAMPSLRRRWQQPRPAFKRWHLCLSCGFIALSLYHLWVSGFYLQGLLEQTVLALLLVAVALTHIRGRAGKSQLGALKAAPGWAIALALCGYVALKWYLTDGMVR